MSKKSAELSANLVAIKGSAAPAPDMPGRVAPAAAVVTAPPAAPKIAATREELGPLNFAVPASFRREFKAYAANHDLKLNELLRRCFAAYRQLHGD